MLPCRFYILIRWSTSESGRFLKAAIDVVHKNGGVFIADEVQPGFARTGDAFWGFARHGIIPDMVTTGKPMGNGIPISGLAAKHEVLAAFSDKLPYFNTFEEIQWLSQPHRLCLMS